MIEWRKIPGFPNYEVSNTGFVRNGHKIIGTQCRRDGYIKCSLTYKRFRLSTSVHRLVAMVFIPNLENKPCVNHKNCNRADNRVENLEWCTYKENNNYGDIQVRHSRSIMGHPKLGAAGRPMKPVLRIKNNTYIGFYESCQDASRKTGVNYRHISECCLLKRRSAGGFIWRRDLDYLLYFSLFNIA